MASKSLLVLLAICGHALGGFVHPGLLNVQADYNRMAQQVAAKASPWIESFNVLVANDHASLSYNPGPVAWAERGANCADNSRYVMNDAAAAYQTALIWKITGNVSYANQAIRILNAWAYKLTGIGCNASTSWDYQLMAATQGYQFANAGEMMRNYSGWNASAFANYQQWMVNVWYPVCFLPMALQKYANWELGCVAQGIAIGVLADNEAIFNDTINYFQAGVGNGAISQAGYFIHPGYYGQGQESGRDQGHDTLDISHLTVIAQQAWNQGIDLYGFANNRILAISEYIAKGNLVQPNTVNAYYQVPWVDYVLDDWPNEYWHYGFSTNAINNSRPTWACIYNHYVNVKGLAAPWTGQQMLNQGSEGTQSKSGCCSGSFDQLGYEVLICTLSNVTTEAAPSGLSYVIYNGVVQLSWWGSAYAQNYSILRAPQGGSYSTIATGITDPRSYNDPITLTSPGIYNYIVVAQPNNVTSQPLTVNANTLALVVWYTFNQKNGTTIIDSSGNGYNGTLTGNGTSVSGVMNNALKLDGSTSYVTLPGPQILNTLSDFTIASWMYYNTSNKNGKLFYFGCGTYRYTYFTSNNNNRYSNNGSALFQITYNNGYDTTQALLSPIAFPTYQWFHIAITRLGTTTTMYLNGTIVASMTDNYLSPNQICQGTNFTPQIWLGYSQWNEYLNAIIDDFRIYQGALTFEQVSALANNLTTYLKFDQTNGTVAYDTTSNINNGVLTGGASFVPGLFNNAISLSGSSQYVSLPTGLMANITDFTVAAWVYLNSARTWGRVFDFGNSTSYYMFLTTENSNGVPRFCISLGSTYYNLDAPSSYVIPTQQWTHLAVTLHGTLATLYIDGTAVNSMNITITPSQLGATTNNWIGRSQYSGDPYLNGLVDDFQIYQKALTVDKILGLAQNFNTYYKFDESSIASGVEADYTGNNNTGTLVGNVSFVAGGINNNAIQLSGMTGSYVSLPSNLLNNLSDFTVATWVYVTAQNNWTRVFDFGYGTGLWMMFTPQCASGYALFSIYNTAAQYYLVTPAPLPIGKWLHVGITLSGGNATYYLNGQQVVTTVVPLSPLQLYGGAGSLTPQNTIGHSQYSADPYLNGIIDDFRIYNGALNATQIAVLARQEVVYLAFTESTGTSAYDSSGNGNSATLVGNATFVPWRANSNAVKLDGSTGYLTLPAGLLNNVTDFSVIAWVYVVKQQTWQRVFDFGFGNTTWMMFTSSNNNGQASFIMKLNSASTWYSVSTSSALPTGQWTHVALTGSQGLITIYLNGQISATGTITIAPRDIVNGVNGTNLTAINYVGHSQFSGDPLFNGIIADFRFYRGALSYDQVAAIAQKLNTYLTFDTATNGTSPDVSGNGNLGTFMTNTTVNINTTIVALSNATIVSGKVSNSILLNGNASYVYLPATVLTNLSEFTVSTWVYLNSSQSSARIFDFGWGTGRYFMFTPYDGNGNSELAVAYGQSGQTAYGNGFPTGLWIHVAATLGGAPGNSTGNFYVNGQLWGTAPLYIYPNQLSVNATTAGLSPGIYIGQSQFYGSPNYDPYLNASVDEFKIYHGAFSALQISALAQGLNLYLPFNESSGVVTFDATGNGNIGLLNGGASFVAGRFGNAVLLNSSNSGYVSLPTGIVSLVTDFTASAWVYLYSAQTWGRVFDFGNGTSNYMFLTTGNSNGVPRFSIVLGGSTSYNLDAPSALPILTWTNIAVTLRANVATMYINGTVVASITNVTIKPSQLGATNQNWIGRSQFSADPYLNGIVDDFQFYGVALSVDEILALSQTLFTYLPFNNATGNVTSDVSSFGDNGILTGNASLTTGYIGKAVNLTGGYVNLTNNHLLANLSDFTVTSWIYLSAQSSGAHWFDFGFGTNYWVYGSPYSNVGYPQFTIYNGNTQYAVYGPSIIPANVWTHIAVTLAGNVATIYLNGSAVASDLFWIRPMDLYASAFATNLTAQNCIGFSQYSSDPHLNGLVDEFRIYYGALSANQIAKLASGSTVLNP